MTDFHGFYVVVGFAKSWFSNRQQARTHIQRWGYEYAEIWKSDRQGVTRVAIMREGRTVTV